jgi:hypothetical protein
MTVKIRVLMIISANTQLGDFNSWVGRVANPICEAGMLDMFIH